MTEIKIEKKKPVWPWVLLVLGLLIAAWFFFLRNDKAKPMNTVENNSLIEVKENNTVVANYVMFIETDTNKMSLDHAFTSEAINKLTDAVDAMATEVGYDVKVDIDKAKQYGQEITNDPLSTNHADKIKSAVDLLSTSLQNIQKAKYPELGVEADEVKSAAMAINPVTLTLDQRVAVKTFFKKAAELLNKMN